MKEKTRIIFIDLLRGWALLVMIEVHIFNSMLMPSLKSTDWFPILNFINGLVAPSFLFVSGFVFMLSTKDDTFELRKFGKRFWKKLGRITLILLAGYSLHLPILSLRRMLLYYSPDVILRSYNVDILQCIAAGLLFLFVLRIIIKSDDKYNKIVFALAILIFLVSPLVWKIDWGKFFIIPIAAYFNKQYGSLFPLFPWLGFLFSGTVTAKLYLNARTNNNEKKFIMNLTIVGLAFALGGHFLLSGIFPENYRMIRPHPVFDILRLGWVLFLLGMFWYYAEYRNTKRSFVLDVGRESLLVYWLHLEIIYRHFWKGQSLVSAVNHKLNFIEAVMLVLIVATLMVLVAKIWGRFKKDYREPAAKLTFTIVSLCIIIFLIGF